MTHLPTDSSRHRTAAEWFSRLNCRETGLFCLGLLFALGCWVLFVDVFVDEGDKLAVALLMLRGMRLYGDLFAHHFPFVFDWLAVVFRLLGPSILFARWSMLAFQLVTFAAVMRLTRLYTPIGVLAVLWGCIGHLYWANMVIYQGFAGLSMMAVFILTLTALAGRRCEGRVYWLALGLFAAIAILSDPIMAIGVGVALASLMISRAGRKHVVWAVLVLLVVFAAYGVRLGRMDPCPLSIGMQSPSMLRSTASTGVKRRPVGRSWRVLLYTACICWTLTDGQNQITAQLSAITSRSVGCLMDYFIAQCSFCCL